jgi:NRPS condensation-like uncharacterized protein
MTARTTRFTALDETADLMERRGEPNLIYLELAVAGRLEPDRLRTAVHAAFAAHPATRSRRTPTPPWRTRSRWHVSAQPDAEPLTVRAGPGLDLDAERRAILDHPLDLRRSPLLRLRLLSGAPGGDRLLLVAHHAGFDGMGFVGVLLAVCAAYNGQTVGGQTVGGPTVGLARPTAPPPAAHSHPEGLGRATAREGVGPAPRAILPPRPVRIARQPAPARRRGYGLVPLRFDVDRSAALAQAARAAGVTLNDLLLAALALTVTRWNRHHGRPTAPLRITMPVNTRDQQARHDGDGNHSRLTSVDAAGDDPPTLLAAIAARTAEAKTTPAGPQGGPAAVVLGAPWLPRGLRQALAPGVRFAARSFADTTMLSNLGRIAELPRRLVGAGEVTELWAAAPAPMPRGLSVTALSAHGRLHLMIRHRFEALDAPAAAAFTDLFAHTVTDLSELATPASPEPQPEPPHEPHEPNAGRPRPDAFAAPAPARRTEGNP